MAVQAYDKVLSTAKDISLIANARLGRTRSLIGLKKYGEAHKMLEAFIKDEKLSKLALVVDANLLLVDVASEEGKIEKDDRERARLFNAAVDALKMVRGYRTTPEEQAELDLMTGEVLLGGRLKKGGVEHAGGRDARKAIVAFQG